jgi:hypothetical protein
MACLAQLDSMVSKLIQTTFSSRIPLPTDVLQKYLEGYADWDKSIGLWLEEFQSELAAGEVDPILPAFLLPGVFPRVLASCLLDLVESKPAETIRTAFLEECALLFVDPVFDDLEIELRNPEELSQEESAVTLAALCFALSRRHIEEIPKKGRRQICLWAESLASAGSTILKSGAKTRLLGRLVERLTL